MLFCCLNALMRSFNIFVIKLSKGCNENNSRKIVFLILGARHLMDFSERFFFAESLAEMDKKRQNHRNSCYWVFDKKVA